MFVSTASQVEPAVADETVEDWSTMTSGQFPYSNCREARYPIWIN